ncbi:MAG: hypothetical protein BGO05_00525 [Rhizobiales bacterium 63-7]|uniref:hypothetical protein n=1 Tax=Rhizobium sp. YJ-22 TaxID=3037556 RepID=UPI000925C890|nr:hypothetical protein [Rhizobium sp. YJ-22]MBN9030083.1 hypothetical protein [Hyphomicrobiales bacterium]MDG3578876.1 hypothetical protein [Rhizobium sp. YJ-22]OJU71682.1 MAG: hypothetical protein BGO05_00525 [Rhizobiales bacterium 63-7]
MPIATGTFETPLAMRYVQQMSREFTDTEPDAGGGCSQVSLPGGGMARLQAGEHGLTVTLISDDPQVIARSKRIIEGYFEHVAAGLPVAPVWIDSDA